MRAEKQTPSFEMRIHFADRWTGLAVAAIPFPPPPPNPPIPHNTSYKLLQSVTKVYLFNV